MKELKSFTFTLTIKQIVFGIMLYMLAFVLIAFAYISMEKEVEEANRKLITAESRLADAQYEERMCKQGKLFNNISGGTDEYSR